MSTGNRNAPTQHGMDTPTKPGDEAPPGTIGTGETVCPECAGTGRKDAAPCRNCNGTGKIIQGIGGA
jgi:DnaJ-class molecular chaperone